LRHMILELPALRSPTYLLVVGIVVSAGIFSIVPALIFWQLSLAKAIAVTAIVGFLLACGLRFTERERHAAQASPRDVREVFPF